MKGLVLFIITIFSFINLISCVKSYGCTHIAKNETYIKIDKSILFPYNEEKRQKREIFKRDPDSEKRNFHITPYFGNGVELNPKVKRVIQTAVDIWNILLRETIVSSDFSIEFHLDYMGRGILGQSNGINMVFPCEIGSRDEISESLERLVGYPFPKCDQLKFKLPPQSHYGYGYKLTKIMSKLLGFKNSDQFYGPVDGIIMFNSQMMSFMDTDISNGISSDKPLLLSIVIHEIGHLLGFVSSVDDVDRNQSAIFYPTILDLYRFNQFDNVDNMESERMAKNSEEYHYYVNPFNNLDGFNRKSNLMSRGIFNGDGSQASHWEDDAITQEYMGIMDPSLRRGIYEQFTMRDIVAFRNLGYKPNIAIDILLLFAKFESINQGKRVYFISEFNFDERISCLIDDFTSSATYNDHIHLWECPYTSRTSSNPSRLTLMSNSGRVSNTWYF